MKIGEIARVSVFLTSFVLAYVGLAHWLMHLNSDINYGAMHYQPYHMSTPLMPPTIQPISYEPSASAAQKNKGQGYFQDQWISTDPGADSGYWLNGQWVLTAPTGEGYWQGSQWISTNPDSPGTGYWQFGKRVLPPVKIPKKMNQPSTIEDKLPKQPEPQKALEPKIE